MECVTPFVSVIIDSMTVPIKEYLGFFFSSTKHVANMTKKLSKLKEAKHDMEKKHDQALINDQLIPPSLPHWLEKVEKITRETKNVLTSENGWLNFKTRYEVGKSSFNILQEIDYLLEEQNNIKIDEQRPLAMVIPSIGPSTFKTDYDVIPNIFPSRVSIFNDVLKSLEPDNKTQSMALCGLGGVGKTTMMEEIKKVVEKKGKFQYVLRVDIGRNYDPTTTQKYIAQCMKVDLSEETKQARVERLKKSFEGISKIGKNILLILDDVWEAIDLNDIGLTSPFPKGFKLLVTSRYEKVCIKMDIDTKSIFKIHGLEEAEANSFFWETVKISNGDSEIRIIGEDILKKCKGLPIAIKTIALALRGEEKDSWEVAQKDLQRHNLKDIEDLENVYNIFEISYNHLNKDEDKVIFVLCGLFLDDFNIVPEELLRFGWGLQFFKKSNSMVEARKQTNMSIHNLIRANLLTNSYTTGCVKMHDLARDFVLSNISEFKQASVVNHSDKFEWPTKESCERILLTCKGMSKFPEDFYYPNLALLKLMNGDRKLNLPEDFPRQMEKLKVIGYEKMQYPFSVVSLCYSTNLRTLCLHYCSLVDNDISFLGNLFNLEVLSLAYCEINKLPSTIKELKMLKLLDLTECFNLCIDEGVFQSLDKLEEIYMRVSQRKSIRFSDTNCDELKLISHKLNALEVEFFKNNLQPKSVSFKNLQRFRISMGCFLNQFGVDKHSFKNTLMLVTNSNNLLECKINELFSKTEKLYLSVKDMSNVGDISMSPTQASIFYNLKVLHVFKCKELTHLFTIPMANGLKKLESLMVSSCPLLKSIVSSCDSVNVMELPQLVELTLNKLPNFTSLILDNDISATLPPLLNKEVVIPKLSKLLISGLKKLKQIWACDFTSLEEDDVSMLKVIEVKNCNSLVNLFPCNPMRLLTHLEELKVNRCCSIEVIFNIDLGKIKQHISNNSNLRIIKVDDLEEIREVWRIKEESYTGHLICGFQAVETINIDKCQKFENVFTPVTANFDMRALKTIHIQATKVEKAEINGISKVDEDTTIVGLPSYHLTHAFTQIRKIDFRGMEGAKVLFEIEKPCINRESATPHQQPLPLLPCLEDLTLWNMGTMSHIWKCNNWNKFFILHKHQPYSSFQNLTNIYLDHCNGIKYLFSPLMFKFLSNLKILYIKDCEGIEEIVSSRDDDDDEALTTSTTTLFSCLVLLRLNGLSNLKQIGGGVAKCFRMGVVPWSLCQYSSKIYINNCSLSSLIPSMVEAFESKSSNIDQGSVSFPRPKTITNLHHQLTNLKILKIFKCHLLEYIFTFSTLESLTKLEELRVSSCKAMKVIVREEHGDESSEVVFPRLKSIELDDLPNLVGFFLGTDIDFEWKSLDHVMINKCPQMMVFSYGESKALKLKYINTRLGKHNLECGLNFHKVSSQSSHSSIVCPAAEGKPWSFHNLIEINLQSYYEHKIIVPTNDLQQLQILEKIHVKRCKNVEEVFEVTNNESQTFVTFPKLREVELEWLVSLKYIWKSNKWSTLEFPNLTRLSISDCKSLEHVFTASMVGSLMKLQELHVRRCKNMEVIVKKKEEFDGKVGEIMFPCLKSLKLADLARLKGFLLGRGDFCFPSMNTLVIKNCPKIRIFSEGRAIAHELKLVETSFGVFQRGENINSFITSKIQEGFIF